MDNSALHRELEHRKAVHDGDEIAAMEDVLGGVLKGVDDAVTKSERALAEADAAARLTISQRRPGEGGEG